jgi:hypothetical protein
MFPLYQYYDLVLVLYHGCKMAILVYYPTESSSIRDCNRLLHCRTILLELSSMVASPAIAHHTVRHNIPYCHRCSCVFPAIEVLPNFHNEKSLKKVVDCSEVAEYIGHCWEDTQNSNRVFMLQVQTLDGVAAVDTHRRAKEARTAPILTQDELTQKEEEATDAVWKRKGSAVEVEASLRIKLKACFECNRLGENMKKCHRFFTSQMAELETGKIMGYITFSNFIKGIRENALKNDQHRQLEIMLANYHTKSSGEKDTPVCID